MRYFIVCSYCAQYLALRFLFFKQYLLLLLFANDRTDTHSSLAANMAHASVKKHELVQSQGFTAATFCHNCCLFSSPTTRRRQRSMRGTGGTRSHRAGCWRPPRGPCGRRCCPSGCLRPQSMCNTKAPILHPFDTDSDSTFTQT